MERHSSSHFSDYNVCGRTLLVCSARIRSHNKRLTSERASERVRQRTISDQTLVNFIRWCFEIIVLLCAEITSSSSFFFISSLMFGTNGQHIY